MFGRWQNWLQRADRGISVLQLIQSVFSPEEVLSGNSWLLFGILNLLLGRPVSPQVAVCHRECRHRFWRVFEGQEGSVAESGADAGSGAQPAIQRPPGARGRLADLRAAWRVWVSRRPSISPSRWDQTTRPANQFHSVGPNYPSCTSTLSLPLLTDVLRFDNTYSIFQAKRLSFTVEVLLPDSMQSPKANGGVQEPPTSWDQQQHSSTLLLMWPNLFSMYLLSPFFMKEDSSHKKKKKKKSCHYSLLQRGDFF